MSIGQRIKLIRSHAGITRDEFAERIGIHKNTLANYESGERKPDYDVTVKICQVFKVHPLWLLIGEGFQAEGDVIVEGINKDGRGTERPLYYQLDQDWSKRVLRELNIKGKTDSWLVKETNLSKDRIYALLYKGAIPTLEEIWQIADVIKVDRRYLAERSPFKADHSEPHQYQTISKNQILTIAEAVADTGLTGDSAREITAILYDICAQPINIGKASLDALKKIISLAQEIGMIFSRSKVEGVEIPEGALKRLVNWGTEAASVKKEI